jgi:hypothetical protein
MKLICVVGVKPDQKVYPDELEDIFYEYFETEFSTLIEDGSIEEVSKMIVDLYYRMSVGDFSLLTQIFNAKVPKGSQMSLFKEDIQTVSYMTCRLYWKEPATVLR